MKYVLLCRNQKTYDTYGKDKIHEDYVKKGWKEILPNGDDWKRYIPVFQSKGITKEDMKDMGVLPKPEETYVLFVYGMNDEGEQTTEVVEYRFTLPKMQKIEGFTFEIKTVDADNPDGPIFEITPSNDNYEYALYVGSYSLYESRKDKPEEVELMALELGGMATTFTTKGKCTFGPGEPGPGLPFYASIKSKLRWRDYALFVFGYDEKHGVSTPVQVVKIPKRK